MKIAIEGCAHGELDMIYSAIKAKEDRENIKVDLLICCGDFQASRNMEDLACMAVPPKYRHICSFYKYFSGEEKAPLLTIFIGGNHEASNYLQELPYGGWVAPNIYYMGYAGVVNVAGVRIAGLSGIYKRQDYMKGRFEKAPYDDRTKRSVYHIRNLEVFRLKQLSQPIDIFLSHDWPVGVYHHGNVEQLLQRKPFFRDEIDRNELGSQPCADLLGQLKPKRWFSAHLHCKFTAQVPHENNEFTHFLALDKCLPRRHFLEVVDVPHDSGKSIELTYDLEWLTILYLTNHLLSVKSIYNYMPGPGGNERYTFTPTEEEKSLVLQKIHNDLKVPENFTPTAPAYQPGGFMKSKNKQPEANLNPQTVEFCDILGVTDPVTLVAEQMGLNLSLDSSFLNCSTFIADTDQSSLEDSGMESRKLTPLKLPDPKVNTVISQAEVIETRTDKERTEVAPEGDAGLETSDRGVEDISPKRGLGDDSFCNDFGTSAGGTDVNTSTPLKQQGDLPPNKKFKRRNLSIYGADNSGS